MTKVNFKLKISSCNEKKFACIVCISCYENQLFRIVAHWSGIEPATVGTPAEYTLYSATSHTGVCYPLSHTPHGFTLSTQPHDTWGCTIHSATRRTGVCYPVSHTPHGCILSTQPHATWGCTIHSTTLRTDVCYPLSHTPHGCMLSTQPQAARVGIVR